MQNARNSLCRKQCQFLWENSEQFYLMQKTDLVNVVSRSEYTVNIMCREQILLM